MLCFVLGKNKTDSGTQQMCLRGIDSCCVELFGSYYVYVLIGSESFHRTTPCEHKM